MATSGRPLRIAVINDYEVVVRGVHALLAPFDDRVQVLELDVNRPVSVPVDVALYDTFAMEGVRGHGLDDIVANDNIAALAFYTWNLDRQTLQAATDRGVAGVLSKALSGAELVTCMERIHAGERVLSPEPTTDAPLIAGDWPGRSHKLTAREAEVVALIAQGLSNQEIADRSYLSINSVKSYIRSAYRTMGVTTRSQAVRWCMLRGIDKVPQRIPIDAPNGSAHGAVTQQRPSDGMSQADSG
ncbi:MAG: response regulator transcription factor [Ornithinimicrobium sp.]